MNINNQYDFFKKVRLDEDGNMVTSDGENISIKSDEIAENTVSTKEALMAVSSQLEDVKNLLKLILS
tara:strand:- start:310 stop:510 length:201 start_codon:yes stop_codon:yes gene_type:complete